MGVVVAGICVFGALGEIRRYLDFLYQSNTVPAQVVNLEVISAATHPVTRRFVTYEYEVASIRYQGRLRVSSDFYVSLQTGSTIAIRHLRTEPGSSTIVGQEIIDAERFTLWEKVMGLLLLTAVALVPVVLYWPVIRNTQRGITE
jgi:hypothetical protein